MDTDTDTQGTDSGLIVAALTALSEQDANDPDGDADVIIQRMDVPREPSPLAYLPRVADLFKLNRGAFRPNVGGLDDLAIVGGQLYVRTGGEWEYTGEDALPALRGDWCPDGCGPIADLYDFTASVQPTLFGAFAVLVSSDLANLMNRTGVELSTLGEEELYYLGSAMAAIRGDSELAIDYTTALLVLDGTVAKCQR